jgi:peptidoglycan glycosyltransferase
VTSAAALSTGRYKPDSVIDAPPSYTPPLTTLAIKNFAGELCGAGKLTLADALATSCNTAFAKLGTALGQGPLENQANAFGIGKPPPSFPLPLARSIFATGTLDAPAIAQSAIGQRDVALTPMQAALMTAAIANKGIALDPYLVAEEHAPDNSVLKSTTPTPLGQALSADVATQLTQMMVGVTTKGTAAGVFNDLGYAVAGKTGTAQHGDNVPPHTWFAGFAPADNPQYAVVAFVEDGGTAGTNAQGASVSAPIVHDVLKALVKP